MEGACPYCFKPMLRAVCPPLWHGGQPLKCRACGGGVYTDARDEELSYWTEDDVNVTVYRDPAVERAFRKKFQRYRSVLPAAGGTLLEVGCGAGLFLAWGASQGWNMRGLDISSHAIALSQEACRKADLFCGTIDEAHYPAQSVNGVVLWDVIEHVQSPETLLKAVARILTPRGFVLLETPDEGCLPRRLIRGAYTLTRGRINALPYLYYPAHKWYYTRNAMRLALSRTGFEHISFYRERTVGELAVRKRRHYHAAPSFSHKVSHAALEAVSIVPVLRNKMVVVAYKAPMVGDRSRLSP